MLRTVVALAAVVAAGCSKPPAEEPEGPRGSPKEAVKETRELVEEAYRVLRDGDPVSLMGLLAPDLFFVGPGPQDVGLDRAAAIELASAHVDSREKHKLRSLGLEIEAGPDGVSAWAIDQLEYDGTAFAVTIIAAQVDGLWAITAVEVARALPDRKLAKLAGPGPLPALPRWQPPEAKVSAHGDAPREVVDALTAAAGDVVARLDQYGKQKDAAFVGPSPDQVSLGAKAIAKAWKKRAPAWSVDDTLAAATPDGGLVWAVAHGALLDEPAPVERDDRKRKRRDRDDDDDDDDRDRDDRDDEAAPPRAGPPRRLFVVYRNDDGGRDAWQLAVWHESVALPR